jgi:hypothetical protein
MEGNAVVKALDAEMAKAAGNGRTQTVNRSDAEVDPVLNELNRLNELKRTAGQEVPSRQQMRTVGLDSVGLTPHPAC